MVTREIGWRWSHNCACSHFYGLLTTFLTAPNTFPSLPCSLHLLLLPHILTLNISSPTHQNLLIFFYSQMIASLNIPLLELCDLILTYVLVTVLVPWQRQFPEKKPFSWSLITLIEGWSMIIMMVSRQAQCWSSSYKLYIRIYRQLTEKKHWALKLHNPIQWSSSSKSKTLLQQTPSSNLSKQLSTSRASIKTMSFGD